MDDETEPNAIMSNYVIFRPCQRKLNYSVNIEMIDNCTQTPTTLECKICSKLSCNAILEDSFMTLACFFCNSHLSA